MDLLVRQLPAGKHMILISMAAILFGLVHPGSKLLLDSGVDLLSFCILYVGIRWTVQLFIAFKNRHYLITRRQLAILIPIGIIGALLQITEFIGISDGIPVPTVTFLVYSHPIWTVILGKLINGEPITPSAIFKVIIAVIGLCLVVNSNFSNLAYTCLYNPLIAGLLIASWICLSNFAQRKGISTWTLSFYYDLGALIGLLGIRALHVIPSVPAYEIYQWLSEGDHFFHMSIFSIVIGLFPNLLFYFGSTEVSSVSAGLLLLLEPVVSSLASLIMWNTFFSHRFFWGATLVLLSASTLLDKILRNMTVVLRQKISWDLTVFVLTMIATLLAHNASASTIHVVEIVPTGNSDYTISSEFRQISTAVDQAARDMSGTISSCNLKFNKILKLGNETELLNIVKKIAYAPTAASDILIGLSRSSFARTAAKATQGTKLKAISIGAASVQLSSINSNFFSVAAPWQAQWDALKAQSKKSKCNSDNTVGFFDLKDHLSNQFMAAFKANFGSKHIYYDSPPSIQFSCAFVGLSFSAAQNILRKLLDSNKDTYIFGIGDWNYYSQELRRTLLGHLHHKPHIIVPTGWTPNSSIRSQVFSKKMQVLLSETPGPVAAYSYDAAILAIEELCTKEFLNVRNLGSLRPLPLLRKYLSISATGNFISKMRIIEY